MFPIWFLDEPDICTDNPDPVMFTLKGWIAAPGKIGKLKFKDRLISQLMPITTGLRIDILQAYNLPATGFQASCKFELVKKRDYLELEFYSDDTKYEIIVPVHSGKISLAEQKKNKLKRLRSIMKCPECGDSIFDEHEGNLTCSACKSQFPVTNAYYNFLTPALREKFNIVPTSNVSANHYDGFAFNIINRNKNGLILDCGAGLREKYYGNVVNYEIVAYESTDVLGVAESLPFQDNCFDAVFSFAVLEHVKDPFLCAKELVRVLKPDGEIYCNIPFLQPLHGYPHHYYNMSIKGTENLFDGLIRIERSEVLNMGQPIFALSWFLNSYLAGLPEDVKEQFLDMKVQDLIKPGINYLGSDYVLELSKKTQEELSCCNILYGTKTDK
ncbi:MAG: methyltransferase domain-containing protein, partial [Lentisphaerae bacterium]|nr:methyltransferase domain-containing protein [Lentisphaerota bacterium]